MLKNNINIVYVEFNTKNVTLTQFVNGGNMFFQ